jgi:hypothetical protein
MSLFLWLSKQISEPEHGDVPGSGSARASTILLLP